MSAKVLLWFLGFVFWLYMLVECFYKEPYRSRTRLGWTLAILFLHVIGALLYFLIRRPKRIAETGA